MSGGAPKPLEILGTVYASTKIACEELKLDYAYVFRIRKERNVSMEEAIMLALNKPGKSNSIMWNGVSFPSTRKACQDSGIKYDAVLRYMRVYGYTAEEAMTKASENVITKRSRRNEEVIIDGRKLTLSEFMEEYNASYPKMNQIANTYNFSSQQIAEYYYYLSMPKEDCPLKEGAVLEALQKNVYWKHQSPEWAELYNFASENGLARQTVRVHAYNNDLTPVEELDFRKGVLTSAHCKYIFKGKRIPSKDIEGIVRMSYETMQRVSKILELSIQEVIDSLLHDPTDILEKVNFLASSFWYTYSQFVSRTGEKIYKFKCPTCDTFVWMTAKEAAEFKHSEERCDSK